MTQVKSPSFRRSKYQNHNRRAQQQQNGGSSQGQAPVRNLSRGSSSVISVSTDEGGSGDHLGDYHGNDSSSCFLQEHHQQQQQERKVVPLSILLGTVNEIVEDIERAQRSEYARLPRNTTSTCTYTTVTSKNAPAAKTSGAKSEPPTTTETTKLADGDSRLVGVGVAGGGWSSKTQPSSYPQQLETVAPIPTSCHAKINHVTSVPGKVSIGDSTSISTASISTGAGINTTNANLIAQGTFDVSSNGKNKPVITSVQTSIHPKTNASSTVIPPCQLNTTSTTSTNKNKKRNSDHNIKPLHGATTMTSTVTLTATSSHPALSSLSPASLHFPVIDYDADNEDDNRSTSDGKGGSSDGDGGGDNDSTASECGADLTKFTKDQLDVKLAPIMRTLTVLDVNSVLPLEDCDASTTNAAEAGNGKFVKAIHDMVEPPVVAPVRYQFLRNNNGGASSDNRFTPVRYIHVYELPNHYSAGVFVFPPFAKIPLHDHPGMCVLSRILYGTLSLYSYDWIEGEACQTTYIEEKRGNNNDSDDDSENGMSVDDSDDDDMEDPMEKLIQSRLQALGTANSVSNSWLGKATQEFSRWSSKALKASSNLMGSSSNMMDVEDDDDHHDDGEHSSNTKQRRRNSLTSKRQQGRRGSGNSRRQPPSNKIPIVKRLARCRPVRTVTAPMVTTLYPFEGNVHEFVAGPNGAAVLDVLLPPYDEDHDRDCTFYVPEWNTSTTTHNGDSNSCSGSSSETKVLLRQIPQPEDFQCIGGTYGNVGASE